MPSQFDLAGVGLTTTGAAAALIALAAVVLLITNTAKRLGADAEPRRAPTRHGATSARDYEEALRRWQQHRDELKDLLDAACHTSASSEHAYRTVPVTLLSHSAPRGEAGQLTITQKGLVFDGSTRHEWSWTGAEEIRHLDQDCTLVRFVDDPGCSIITYGEAPVTRMYLDLALAVLAGTQSSFVREVARSLSYHESRRPRLPVPWQRVVRSDAPLEPSTS